MRSLRTLAPGTICLHSLTSHEIEDETNENGHVVVMKSRETWLSAGGSGQEAAGIRDQKPFQMTQNYRQNLIDTKTHRIRNEIGGKAITRIPIPTPPVEFIY